MLILNFYICCKGLAVYTLLSILFVSLFGYCVVDFLDKVVITSTVFICSLEVVHFKLYVHYILLVI